MISVAVEAMPDVIVIPLPILRPPFNVHPVLGPPIPRNVFELMNILVL